MQDISEHLRAASQAADGWSVEHVESALDTRRRSAPSDAKVDWERDNEQWGRVLDTAGVLGLVSVSVPLVILRSRAAAINGVQVVSVSAMASAELRARMSAYKGTTKPGCVGNGTTMDAVRHEAATGASVGGSWHTTKAQESLRGLNNWMRRTRTRPATTDEPLRASRTNLIRSSAVVDER